MTKLDIINRLWSHVGDLLLLVKGQGVKPLEAIEAEMNETAAACQAYTDADDDELFQLMVKKEVDKAVSKIASLM